MTITRYVTQRGFAKIDFTDSYDEKCSIQKSSSATKNAIWFGQDGAKRMHLTQEQVEELLPILTNFAKTGEI